MTSRIGSREKGFTLVEIMVTTVIFSLTVVLIYETFFRSLDLLNYCSDYLRAVSIVDDRMWQAQNELTRFNTLKDTPSSDTLTLDNKNFAWRLSCEPVAGATYLYRINSALSWREGSKEMAISRDAYALYEEKK